MQYLELAAWTLGSVLFVAIAIWIGVRMMRWAKKGSQGAALVGLGVGLPAALLNANPQPPKQVQIEEVAGQIYRKKNSDSGDPESNDAATLGG